MFGAAAMSLSSFCVVSNALRLNFFNLRSPRHDRRGRPAALPVVSQAAPALKKTLRIQGMMCEHCEATVQKALEAVPGGNGRPGQPCRGAGRG